MIIYLINILLVDDEKDNLRLVRKYLDRKGAHVSAYSNPFLALQDFIKNNNNDNDSNYYDLVISDIRMPEINGIELASIIRKMNKEIPIILMIDSGITDIDHSIVKFLNIEYIITKTIELKDLIEKINTIKQKKVIVKPLV